MSARPDPVLFEAVCTPPSSLGRRGMRAVALLVVSGSSAVAALCLVLGAWPVLGFVGLEVLLVLGLLEAHRRWSRRESEVLLLLAGGRLLVRRTDARGRRQERSFDAYWARLSLEERPGGTLALLVTQRGASLEIGAWLGEERKRDLAQALGRALRRYREPVFDNPQLRPAAGE